MDGLLPEPHDSIVQELLFDMALVHGLSKLRIHTTSTVATLKAAIKEYGRMTRRFKAITCPAFETVELPGEMEKRARAAAQKAQRTAQTVGQDHEGPTVPTPAPTPSDSAVGKRTSKSKKTYNLVTYKYHSSGDYPEAIPLLGTADSYSTQLVSCVVLSYQS